MAKKSKRKGAVTQARITFEQYDAMRQTYFNTGSISKAAEAAGVKTDSAARYIKFPYPEYGGEDSIADWAAKRRMEYKEEAGHRAKVVQDAALVALNSLLLSILEPVRGMRLQVKGVRQDNGTVLVDAKELGRVVRAFQTVEYVHARVNDRVFNLTAGREGETPQGGAQPGAVSVNVAFFGGGFQGQRDVGQPVFRAPQNPRTLFEHSLSLGSRNAHLMNRLGSEDHEMIVEAARRGHARRLEAAREEYASGQSARD